MYCRQTCHLSMFLCKFSLYSLDRKDFLLCIMSPLKLQWIMAIFVENFVYTRFVNLVWFIVVVTWKCANCKVRGKVYFQQILFICVNGKKKEIFTKVNDIFGEKKLFYVEINSFLKTHVIFSNENYTCLLRHW